MYSFLSFSFFTRCSSTLEVVMRRQSMSRKQSKRQFRRGAERVHSKNRMTNNPNVMRGGIRL